MHSSARIAIIPTRKGSIERAREERGAAGEAQHRMKSDMSFELAGGPYAVTAARLALSDLDQHLDPSVAFDVRLLVSELVTNSVQHAQVSAEDSITMEVRITDDAVRVQVKDEGPGFEAPAIAPPPDADAGWGLFLVEQIADSWGVNTEERAVWFEIGRDRGAKGSGGETSESTAA
jgi:anti-sigma regulatory factor (Ser/Thr protein kinase)